MAKYALACYGASTLLKTCFVSVQSVRFIAEQRANQFCGKKGKIMQVLSEGTSTPAHILGNIPKIEIIFEI